MPTEPQHAALYCRLSYALDGSLEKVERQEADGRALSERLQWPICCVYVDNSRSAWRRDRKRHDWEAMLASLRPDASHQHDSIITYHGDRLNRQPWDLELLLRIADDRQIQLASVSGVRDLTNPDDRFILRIEAAQACKSSDDTSRRVRRGWEARVKSGRPSGGGKRPFGFGDLTTVDPTESRLLAEAADRLLAGQSLYGICRWLDTVSTTSQGNRWTPRALKHLLVAPRIAGLVEHQSELYEAVWEPIIGREQWEDVRALFEANAVDSPHPGAQPQYLLSGIASCGLCEQPLRTKPTGGRNRKTKRLYACITPGCRKIGRDQHYLDEYVIGRVLRRLGESDLADELATPNDDGTAADIVELERRRRKTVAQLKALADHPSVSPDIAAQAIESFDARIAELRQRRAESQRSRLLVRMLGITREQWDAQPLDVRRSTVRALFEIAVMPTTRRGPGFDVSAIQMERI